MFPAHSPPLISLHHFPSSPWSPTSTIAIFLSHLIRSHQWFPLFSSSMSPLTSPNSRWCLFPFSSRFPSIVVKIFQQHHQSSPFVPLIFLSLSPPFPSWSLPSDLWFLMSNVAMSSRFAQFCSTAFEHLPPDSSCDLTTPKSIGPSLTPYPPSSSCWFSSKTFLPSPSLSSSNVFYVPHNKHCIV